MSISVLRAISNVPFRVVGHCLKRGICCETNSLQVSKQSAPYSAVHVNGLTSLFHQLHFSKHVSSPLVHQLRTVTIGGRSNRKPMPRQKRDSTPEKANDDVGEDKGEESVRTIYPTRDYKQSDLETSIAYLQSEEYLKVYGEKPVWYHFRRNFKGHFYPKKPRDRCVYKGKLMTGNPCPVCRDEHLLLHHQHLDLLTQFIDPKSGDALPHKVTGLCRVQNNTLIQEVELARDKGALEFPLAFRYYNYEHYYSSEELQPLVYVMPEVINKAHIPHAQSVRKMDLTPDIERPRLPNRHTMTEMYKKVGVKLGKRRALETAAILKSRRGQYPKMIAALKREKEFRQRMLTM